MEKIRIHRIRGLAFLLLVIDRYAVFLRVGDELLAREKVPLAPWCDDFHFRHERVGPELETYLVVAFSRRAVRDGIGPGFPRDLDEALRDERPRDRGSEQVFAFVYGVRAEHRIDEIADELFLQIIDEDLFDAALLRLLSCRLDF